jgi:23S rRNA-intervening sequence protein
MEKKEFRQRSSKDSTKSPRSFGGSRDSSFKRSSSDGPRPERSNPERFGGKGAKPFGARKSFGGNFAEKRSFNDREAREERPRNNNTSFRNFEDLDVFKKAYNLSLEIHNFFINTDSSLKPSNNELIVNLKLSSKQVCTSIALFANKGSSDPIENAISLCDSLKVWLKYCLDLECIEFKQWDSWRNSYQEVAKMLIGLANSKG